MTLLRKQRRKVITGISALAVAIAMPVAWFLFLESQHQMRFHPVGGGTWYEQPAYVITRGFFCSRYRHEFFTTSVWHYFISFGFL